MFRHKWFTESVVLKRQVAKAIKHLVFCQCFVMLLFYPFQAAGSGSWWSLDKKGTSDPRSCEGSLVSHSFHTDKNLYQFSGNCHYRHEDIALPLVPFVAGGEWDSQNKVATESFKIYTGAIAHGKWSCPDDPWLNDVKCTLISVTGDEKAQFWLDAYKHLPPLTSHLIKQKSALKAEWETAIAQPPPTNLKARLWGVQLCAKRPIQLTWEDVMSENGYVIERAISKTPISRAHFQIIKYIGPNTTSFVDYSEKPGDTYKYRVRATYDGGNYSGYSNEASVTLWPVTAPVAPSNLKKSGVQIGGSLTLIWKDNSTDESGFLIGRKNPGATSFKIIGQTGQDKHSFTDKSPMSVAGTYTYRVKALSQNGCPSVYSHWLSVVRVGPVSSGHSDAQIKVGEKKKKQLKISAPVFENLTPGQKFTAGKSIFLKTKRHPIYKNLKVKYALYKNDCKDNSFKKPFKVSSNGKFGKVPVGRYCVRAAYLGGKKDNWSKGVPFVVEMKKKVIIVPKKKMIPRKKAVTE